MKKNIVILLILTLLFSACTKTDEIKKQDSTIAESTTTSTSTEQVTSQAETTEEATEEVEEEVIEDIPENAIDVGENAGELIEMNDVLWTDDRFELTFLDLDLSHYPMNDLGPSCRISATNKGDEVLLVGVEKLAINEVEMPTVYDEIALPVGENINDILPLVSHHFMADVVKMGKVWSMDISLYARNEKKDYYQLMGPISLSVGEEGEKYTGFEAKSEVDIQIIGEGLYDNTREVIIPFYYEGQGEDHTIVPKKVKIKGADGEKEFKCVGYQKVGKYQKGFGEAFIIKDDVEGVYQLDELEVEFVVKNPAGNDISKLSASSDKIKMKHK